MQFCDTCGNLLIPRNKKLFCQACNEEFELEKEKQDAPLLVGIGGGTYINTKLGNAEKVIMGIGAGVAVEKTIAEAKENVDTRIDELEKTRNSLDQQLTQVMGKIQENRTRLEELTSKLRDGESTRRV